MADDSSYQFVELLPELMPESVTFNADQVSEIMGWSQHGRLGRTGEPLNQGARDAIAQVRNEWNQAVGSDVMDFDARAAMLYPATRTEEALDTGRSFADWWRKPGPTVSERFPVRDEPITGSELFSAIADVGIGALELPIVAGSGVVDLARAGFKFGNEMYESQQSGEHLQQQLANATRVWNESAGDLIYTPKTASGAGLSAIAFSPFVGLDHAATKYGMEPLLEFMGGRERTDGDQPTALEVSRLKALYDANLAARENNEQLPDALKEEYDSLRRRYEGSINPESGEWQNLNVGALAASMGLRELINLIPDVAGTSWARRNAAQRRVKEDLRRIGINPNDPITRTLGERYQVAARNVAGGQAVKNENWGMVQIALQDAQRDRRQRTRTLYEAADNAGEAKVLTERLNGFNSSMYDYFDPNTSTFAVGDMPVLQARLRQLRGMVEGTPASTTTSDFQSLGRPRLSTTRTAATKAPEYTTIKNLSQFRQTINRSISNTSNNPAEQVALMVLKSKLDNELNGWFEADLKNSPIIGDRSTLSKWKEANDFRRQYAIDFDESQFVSKLVENNLTQSEIKRMLFGLSESNMAPQAARVVQELKAANPSNIDQVLTGLQNDVIFDVLQPLFEVHDLGKINLDGFLRNYNRVFGTRADNQFLKELFPEGTLDEVKLLAQHARAAHRAGGLEVSALTSGRTANQAVGTGWTAGIPRSIAVLSVGHSIAQANLKVNFFANILNRMRGAGGNPNVQKRVLEEMTGKPWANWYPLTSLAEIPYFRTTIETHQNGTQGQPTGWESMIDSLNQLEHRGVSEEAMEMFRNTPNI